MGGFGGVKMCRGDGAGRRRRGWSFDALRGKTRFPSNDVTTPDNNTSLLFTLSLLGIGNKSLALQLSMMHSTDQRTRRTQEGIRWLGASSRRRRRDRKARKAGARAAFDWICHQMKSTRQDTDIFHASRCTVQWRFKEDSVAATISPR